MLSRVRIFATLWTVAHHAPLFMGLPSHEYWSGWPSSTPGNVYALQYSCLENSIDRGAIEKYQCPKGKETDIASTKQILLFNLFFTRILIIVQRMSGSITG